MVYRLRVILDTKEDVFRDIEIRSEDTLEEFHNAITQAFGFEGNEMASFYTSNEEWEQGEEIALFDLSEGEDDIRVMNETAIDDVSNKNQTRLLYVYDFLNMWIFMIELADIAEEVPGQIYPNLMFAHGEIPDEVPKKEFKAEGLDDDEDYDEFDYDNYEDLDYNY